MIKISSKQSHWDTIYKNSVESALKTFFPLHFITQNRWWILEITLPQKPFEKGCNILIKIVFVNGDFEDPDIFYHCIFVRLNVLFICSHHVMALTCSIIVVLYTINRCDHEYKLISLSIQLYLVRSITLLIAGNSLDLLSFKLNYTTYFLVV